MSIDNGLICVLRCDEGYSHLLVKMESDRAPSIPGVTFYLDGEGLPPGPKGFHVHTTGNLQDGCASLGPHYNPTGVHHGGLNEGYAHHGDLGNVVIQKNGNCQMKIHSEKLALVELLGRSLVLHAGRDDLGLGANEESLETGNSGARICCGVIGFA